MKNVLVKNPAKKLKLTPSKQGKKNRLAGSRFERVVRADLEKKGWIVARWTNNVELPFTEKQALEHSKATGIPFKVEEGKLVPAKSTRFRSNTHGFPDFIAFRYNQSIITVDSDDPKVIEEVKKKYEAYKRLPIILIPPAIDIRPAGTEIIGVECKSNGYLEPEEKEKIKWLMDNNVFSKVLVAKKGKKRGEIIYE